MSKQNEETVRELIACFNAGDNARPFEIFDPAIEWDASRFPAPDLAQVYRGHEGVRQFWRGWLSAWATITSTLDDVVAAGDEVAALLHQRNRGRSTGIEMEVDPYSLVFTFRHGKVVRWRFYPTVEAGLAALGPG